MTREQRIRWLWCFGHLAVAGYVQTSAHESLSMTTLSHLLFFDALGAFLCVAVHVSRNFEVWNRSTISHPFGLERSEVLAGLAMSIILLFMGIAFGFFFAIEKTKDSALGVLFLLGFTFFMGLMLSRMIGFVLHSYSNGADLITIAFGGTAAIFAVMATIATVSKRDFSGMGKWLFAGVLVLIVASLLNIFLHLPAMYLVISVVAIVIFSAYILYDVQQVINGGETNYIVATLNIYLDIYNVFVNLLRLLSIFAGNRD